MRARTASMRESEEGVRGSGGGVGGGEAGTVESRTAVHGDEAPTFGREATEHGSEPPTRARELMTRSVGRFSDFLSRKRPARPGQPLWGFEAGNSADRGTVTCHRMKPRRGKRK